MNVELIAHHGDDLLVVRAARVSFAKDTDWEYVPHEEIGGCEVAVLSERDTKLINYLAREKHVLPFRHPQITLRCKAPIFLARQLGKHQVGLSWSEESRRYIDSEPEFFWPDKWRKRAENVKQGSSDEEIDLMTISLGWNKQWPTEDSSNCPVENHIRDGFESGVDINTHIKYHLVNSLHLYKDMLDSGVAPEQARMILPQNMYVNWVWTGSLLSFYQMYKLRSEGHAQREARDFAEKIKEIISPLYPVSWQALEDHA